MESSADVEHIAALLRQRNRRLSLKIAGQIVCGIPLLALGPAVLATVFWFTGLSVADVRTPWTLWFGGLLIVMVPLMIRLEVRTAGRFLGDALQGGEKALTLTAPLSGIYVGMGGIAWAPAYANPRGFSAGATEIFLCGPRLLVDASQKWRLRRRLGSINLQRAAALVAELCSRDKGLELAAVPRGGEQLADLLPMLNWLALQGWIGVGDKVPRVYLYSEARAVLGRAVASSSRIV